MRLLATHTPPPWHLDPRTLLVYDRPPENFLAVTICGVYGVGDAIEANARLIQSAPALHSALRRLVDLIEELDSDGWDARATCREALHVAKGLLA